MKDRVNKNDLKLAKQICKEFDIKCTFDRKNTDSYAWPRRYVVVIGLKSKDKARNKFFSTLFHEIAHVYCNEMRYYRDYNSGNWKNIKNINKIALKAELLAEKHGKRLMKYYFKNMQYHNVYKSEWAQKWLINYIKSMGY